MKHWLWILLFALLIGCGSSITYGGIPYKEPICIPGDKQAAYDEYVEWYNVLLAARQQRTYYCDPANEGAVYDLYCIELGLHTARVEAYTAMLEQRYTDTCPVEGSL